jgi:hypothetical protein
MKLFLIPALVASVTAPAFAGTPAGQIDVPNVLVIKTPVDKAGDEVETNDDLIGLQDVPFDVDAQGDIADQDKFASAVDAALPMGEDIKLDSNTTDPTPDEVTKVEDQADQEPAFELLSLRWRYYHRSRWGGGYYGYSSYPYWGVSRPSYGYYYNRALYPYRYGFSRSYGAYRYNYFWRR